MAQGALQATQEMNQEMRVHFLQLNVRRTEDESVGNAQDDERQHAINLPFSERE